MRTQNGRDEVLLVTYANGDLDRLPEARVIEPSEDRDALMVYGGEPGRKLATLVMANVRKWEWVEA